MREDTQKPGGERTAPGGHIPAPKPTPRKPEPGSYREG
jgi:hypothetical protein